MRAPASPHPFRPGAQTGHVTVVAFTYVASVTLAPPNRHVIVVRFTNGPPRIATTATSPVGVSPAYDTEFVVDVPVVVVAYIAGAS